MKTKHSETKTLELASKHKAHTVLYWMAAFALIGLATLLLTRAASLTASLEPEAGTRTSLAAIGTDPNASNGQFVLFNQTTPAGSSLSETFTQPDGILDNGWAGVSGLTPPVLPVEVVGNKAQTNSTSLYASTKTHDIDVSGDWQISFDADAALGTGHGGVTVGLLNPATFSGHTVFIGNAVHVQYVGIDGTHDNMTNVGRSGSSFTLANHVDFTHTAAGHYTVFLDGRFWTEIDDSRQPTANDSVLIVSMQSIDPAPNSIDNLVLKNSITIHRQGG